MSGEKELFEDTAVDEQPEFLEIFTNTEAKPDGIDCNWHFQVVNGFDVSEIPSVRQAGFLRQCSCDKCGEFGSEIYELYSVYRALAWVEEVNASCRVTLWVSTEKLIFDDANEAFGFDGPGFTCNFLEVLNCELHRLFFFLDVEVEHYSYENKDNITVWF